MSDTPNVQRDADELTRELMLLVNRSEVQDIAASAVVAAAFAQQAIEALLQLLRHKGIVSEGEINAALGNAYHARAHKLKASGSVVVQPMIRPNGSFS